MKDRVYFGLSLYSPKYIVYLHLCATIVTRGMKLLRSLGFVTRTKGLAPNIIDFPSYRVIPRAQFIRTILLHKRRATNGEAAIRGTHLRVRGAKLLDKLIKLAINLALSPHARRSLYEIGTESFITRATMRTSARRNSFAIFIREFARQKMLSCSRVASAH